MNTLLTLYLEAEIYCYKAKIASQAPTPKVSTQIIHFLARTDGTVLLSC